VEEYLKMKYVFRLTALCFLVFFFGCAITVKYDYDKYTDFSKLKTYEWLPIPVRTGMAEQKIQEIKRTIDADLAAKGLSISPDSPDFLVSARMKRSDRVKRKDVKTMASAASRVEEVPVEGFFLSLEFMDPESKRILWEGSAKLRFDEKPSQEKRDAQVMKALKEMLQKYPPPASK
jgi:hypothetical protein